MNFPVKVSIIVPIYNVEKFLPYALESCINQTLWDIEIICINDGSTDGSLEILKDYAKKDSRIVVIDKENGGVSSARNVGLEAANGQWIMFLDPDDYYERNACERVWIEGEEGATDLINFGTDIFPHLPETTPWHRYALSVGTHRYYGFNPDILFKEPAAKPFLWHQAFSRELLEKSKARFDESLIFGEDMAFLIDIYPHATNFAFIEDRLYHYRWIRKDSAMQEAKADLDNRMNQHLTVVKKILAYWKEYGFIEKYGAAILEWATDFIGADLRSNKYEKKDEYLSALKEIFEEFSLAKFADQLPSNIKEIYDGVLVTRNGGTKK